MARYTTRPRANGWVEDNCVHEDETFIPSIEVDGSEQADTGLVTVTGEPIYRLPNPVGFGRDDEW